ncbi:hypothetical protein NADE_005538 [Nannochloris sp. 'desiccata']|nr:hypothetical protein NADE_005538 [Chlorella desiccata (nom. nud.)]
MNSHGGPIYILDTPPATPVDSMAAAAMPATAVPIVELPESPTMPAAYVPSTNHGQQYPTVPQMERVVGDKLRFRGRNGQPLTSTTYDVHIKLSDYRHVPNTSDCFDIGWRTTNEDYVTEFTDSEINANKLFARVMGWQLLFCNLCVGPRGGTTTLSRRHCRDGQAPWQNQYMEHIRPGDRQRAAHTEFLECKRMQCKCRVSFRNLVKIASMFNEYVAANGIPGTAQLS